MNERLLIATLCALGLLSTVGASLPYPMLAPLFADGVLTGSRAVPSAVLVALPDDDARANCDVIAQSLRARGIPTEVAETAQKFGRQIRYAERRGIPFVWFPGAGGAPDEVKDIRSGDQVVADADAWTPPAEDLHPTIETQEPHQ